MWKYLLDDTESWKFNNEQLFEYRKRKTDEYFQMKVQWVWGLQYKIILN